MPKFNKTQQKRAYQAILSKAQKLYFYAPYTAEGMRLRMSQKDYMAIERIIEKYLKKF